MEKGTKEGRKKKINERIDGRRKIDLKTGRMKKKNTKKMEKRNERRKEKRK